MNSAEVLITFKGDTKDIDNKTKNVTSSIGDIAKGNLIATGITKAFGAAWNMVSKNMDSAIDRFDTLSNFSNVMKNLGISADESQQAIDTLADKLLGLPTTLQDGAMAVQRLTAKNGDIKQSTKLFLAMNNAILAGGAPLANQQAALEQLTQAYSKGKMDMMEWRSLQTAMPAQLKQIATAMGYSTEELGEMMRQGDLTQETIEKFGQTMMDLNEKGLEGFGTLEEQARGATGGIRTAITNMNSRIAAGVTEMISAVNKGLQEINMGDLATVFSNIGTTVKNILASLAPYIVKAIKFLADVYNWVNKNKTLIGAIVVPILAIIAAIKIWTTITTILSTAMAILNAVMAMNPITLIILAIIALVAAFVYLWNKCEWFRNFWIGLWEGIKKKFQTFIDFIKLAWEGLKIIFTVVSVVIKSIVNSLVTKFNNFKEKVGNVVNSVVNFFKSIPGKIVSVPGKIFNFFKSLPKKMLNIGLDIVKGIGKGITNGITWIKNIITGFVGNVMKFIKKLFKIGSPSKLMANEIGQWIPKGIGVGITANTDSINKAMNGMQKEMMSTFQVSPQLANSAALHYSPTVVNNVQVNMQQDTLGQMVRDVKTFSGGAKNDYNYGMGV